MPSKRLTQPKEPRKATGRPSGYSEAITAAICAMLMSGKSLRTICATPGMPGKFAVLEWLGKYPEFASQYARAREIQADTLADEIVDISDDGTNDYMADKDGVAAYNAEAVQRSRLRVDARKWFASKLAPKKYGEKLDLNHGGTLEVAHMTRAQFKARLTEARVNAAIPDNGAKLDK